MIQPGGGGEHGVLPHERRTHLPLSHSDTVCTISIVKVLAVT